jgi:predicted peroxiredoxin
MSKLVIISTHFKENLEKATLPWVVGNAALAEDKEVVVFLQGPSVEMAKQGAITGLQFEPFPALDELIGIYVENGGKIMLCGPCMKAHSVATEELIEGSEAAGAATLVELSVESAATFTY